MSKASGDGKRLMTEIDRTHKELDQGLTIERANQVWCADITYIPVRCGCLYLVAIMDWASRHVLGDLLQRPVAP